LFTQVTYSAKIAMLDGKPRSADATALTACTLAVSDVPAIRTPSLG
jgi:hypothetical protein